MEAMILRSSKRRKLNQIKSSRGEVEGAGWEEWPAPLDLVLFREEGIKGAGLRVVSRAPLSAW